MSLTLNTRPAEYAAGFNPLLYKFTRKDYTITGVDSNGGLIRVTFDAAHGNITAQFTYLDECWLKTDDGNYNLLVTRAITAPVFSAGTTKVTFQEAYTVAGGAGYVNLNQSRKNYRVEVEVWNNTTGLKIVDPITYTPKSDGTLNADIQIISSLLSPEIEEDVLLTNLDTNKFFKYYIKYREVYNGYSPALTSDSANIRMVIFAANQVGEINSLVDYVAGTALKKFATLFDKYHLFINSFFNFTFINPGMTSLFIVVRQGPSLNTPLVDVIVDGMFDFVGVIRGQFYTTNLELDQVTTIQVEGRLESNSHVYIPQALRATWGDNGSGNPEVDLSGPYYISDGVRFILPITSITFLNAGNTNPIVTIPIKITKNPAIPSLSLSVSCQLGGVPVAGFGVVSVFVSGDYDLVIDSAIIGGEFDSIVIYAENPSVLSAILEVREPVSVKFKVTEEKTCVVHGECFNPITLLWQNSKGGSDMFTFNINQDLSESLTETKKAMTKTLYANNLSLNDWEVLNWLNSNKPLYKTPIEEMLTTTNKLQKRIGQQVYTVSQAGVLVGCVALPLSQRTRTNQETHNFQVTIELPEQFVP